LGNTLIGRLAVALAYLSTSFFATSAHALDEAKLTAAVRAEEGVLQARIGMVVVDAGTGANWNYRGDERFPLNSTHKTFACAALLAKVDQKALALDQPVSIRKHMLVTYSPITEKKLAPETMTLGEVCHAEWSAIDN